MVFDAYFHESNTNMYVEKKWNGRKPLAQIETEE